MKRSCLKRKSVASNLHVNDDVPEQSEKSYIPGSQNMPGIPRVYSLSSVCRLAVLRPSCWGTVHIKRELCWSPNGMLGEHHHILFYPTLQDSCTTRIYFLKASQWLETITGLSTEEAVKQKLLFLILSSGSNLLFMIKKNLALLCYPVEWMQYWIKYACCGLAKDIGRFETTAQNHSIHLRLGPSFEVNFFILFTVHLGIILFNDQLVAQFFFAHVYFNSLHVSSIQVLIIRRFNCINTISGICHSM